MLSNVEPKGGRKRSGKRWKDKLEGMTKRGKRERLMRVERSRTEEWWNNRSVPNGDGRHERYIDERMEEDSQVGDEDDVPIPQTAERTGLSSQDGEIVIAVVTSAEGETRRSAMWNATKGRSAVFQGCKKAERGSLSILSKGRTRLT